MSSASKSGDGITGVEGEDHQIGLERRHRFHVELEGVDLLLLGGLRRRGGEHVDCSHLISRRPRRKAPRCGWRKATRSAREAL